MNILCGDIGGTKTRLAILESNSQYFNSLAEQSYPSTKYQSLTEIIFEFSNNLGRTIEFAAFGVAGPVQDHRCTTTNLPWTIDARQMELDLNIPSIHLINDLEATAWGINALQEHEIHTLQPGSGNQIGNRAVIAAGTGLGQAGLYWDGERHMPFATEGGHCNFAPGNTQEYELLRSLQHNGGQVCWEDILSGPGLSKIYRFLLTQHNTPAPKWFQQQIIDGDPAADIADRASLNSDPICREAMDLFARLYGAEAGNLGLKLMARGGVYIGGGIAPKILEWLQAPAFLQAFRNKGKMQGLMESMPVRVILNDRAALYGPAVYLKQRVLST